MSNLGLYQWMTKTAKKVGGPGNFMVLVGVTGAITERCLEFFIKKGINKIKTRNAPSSKEKLYKVTLEGRSNEGVVFLVGDQFRILEIDGESILIDKIGDKNNPYFVSAKLLQKISDYKGE